MGIHFAHLVVDQFIRSSLPPFAAVVLLHIPSAHFPKVGSVESISNHSIHRASQARSFETPRIPTTHELRTTLTLSELAKPPPVPAPLYPATTIPYIDRPSPCLPFLSICHQPKCAVDHKSTHAWPSTSSGPSPSSAQSLSPAS